MRSGGGSVKLATTTSARDPRLCLDSHLLSLSYRKAEKYLLYAVPEVGSRPQVYGESDAGVHQPATLRRRLGTPLDSATKKDTYAHIGSTTLLLNCRRLPQHFYSVGSHPPSSVLYCQATPTGMLVTAPAVTRDFACTWQ